MDAVSTGPIIVILAGGTGGHIYPALAVAEELRQRGYQVHWIGTSRGLEARVVPAANFPLPTLSVRGIRGKGLFARLQGVGVLAWALLQALFNGPAQAMIGGSAASFGMIGALSWILFSQQRASGETGLKAFRLILQLAIFLGIMAYLFGGKGWVDCVAGFCVGFPLAALLRPVEGAGVSYWFERMRSR